MSKDVSEVEILADALSVHAADLAIAKRQRSA
jgi:hypothetical protein